MTPKPNEVVIDARTGRPRQAGADYPEGQQILRWREMAERDLYFFAKWVGGSTFLTPSFHGWLCRTIQQTPPTRKMILVPRNHAKSHIISHNFPPHVLIQPREHNIYRPGKLGADTRILLSGETALIIESHMRVIMAFFERNRLFRALWPHLIWPNPNRDAKVWNAKQFIVPRETSFADPSVRALGADSAVTGSRTDVQIKDDLISLKAANSPTEMQSAIDFHKATKPLQDSYEHSLEIILGTRWAPQDLYEYIETNEPAIKVYERKVIENGEPIWPEAFSHERIDALKAELGDLFWLNYMNESTHSSLVDFDPTRIRSYTWQNGAVSFPETAHDALLGQKLGLRVEVEAAPQLGEVLTAKKLERMLGRDEYLRSKYA